MDKISLFFAYFEFTNIFANATHITVMTVALNKTEMKFYDRTSDVAILPQISVTSSIICLQTETLKSTSFPATSISSAVGKPLPFTVVV